MHSQEEAKDSSVAAFSLNSESTQFVSRTQDVFANLGVLEEKHSAFVKAQSHGSDARQLLKADPEDEDEEQSSSRGRDLKSHTHRSRSSDMTHRSRPGLGGTRDQDQERRSYSSSSDRSSMRGAGPRESRDSFRRPRGAPPHPRHRGVPDFKKHPERWTCYSLEDVPDQDLSERSNKQAALAFLEERRTERERQERKAAGLPEEEVKFDVSFGACSQGRISFTRKKSKTNESGDKNKDSIEQERQGKEASVASASENDSDINEGDIDRSDNVADTEKSPQTEVADEKKEAVLKFKPKKQMRRNIRKKGGGSDDSDG